MKHPFRFAVASVDKGHPDWRTAGGPVIHWASVVSLSAALRPVYLAEEARRAKETGDNHPLNESVIVDDNEDADFLTLVKQKFRGLRSGVRTGSPLVKKVRFRGSGPDELVQLADMICGATGAYLDGDDTWYSIFAARDLGIVHIP